MRRLIWLFLSAFLAGSYPFSPAMSAASVQGTLAKWYPIQIDFQGPIASEDDPSLNPFLDYRLTVELTSPSGRVTDVPGFFAGDGHGHGHGNVWRMRFSADETGLWQYAASLRRGSEVAVNLDTNAGTAVALDGATGQFTISVTPVGAPEFLRHGRLEHVGGHYMKFRDGPYWIKGGTDSPENLLGFAGIDGTFDQGGTNGEFLHDYAAHRADWRDGDPLFSHATTGADGRGLIGALNYLGEQGVNSVYFLPMNLGGDGQDTYPFISAVKSRFNKTRYDISKLYQWNMVLNHAQEQGVALNLVLSETEAANELWLDNGHLGVERKLFFRELVARFAYLLAVKWNLGEENDFPLVELQKHADYLQALDWSGKPIAVHTHINNFYRYGELIGDKRFSASSIQYDPQYAGQFVEQWRKRSRDAGHPWVIDMDENTDGLQPQNTDERRKQILYDVLFSGGNIEWYFGYSPLPVGGDIDAGDFRIRESMWVQMRLARQMMQRELPFWRMHPADWRVSGDQEAYGGAEVFVANNEAYAVYLPASSGQEVLNIGHPATQFKLRWFDPRTGQMHDTTGTLAGTTDVRLGSPPSEPGQDWVALLTRSDLAPVQLSGNTVNDAPQFQSVPSPQVVAGQLFTITLNATDTDGTFPSVTVGSLPPGMTIRGPGNGQLELRWPVPATASGAARVELIAIDATDSRVRTTQVMTINVLGQQGQPASENQDADSEDQPAGNQNPPVGPVFRQVAAKAVRVGNILAIRVQADDADGIPPALMVLNAPSHSSFEDNGDGTRTLYWKPDRNAVGTQTITFLARDHDLPSLTATMNVEVQVNP